MNSGFRHRQETRVGLQVRVSPSVLLKAQLLQLGQAELQAAIESELAENPALDRLDDDEPLADESILKAVAPCELKAGSEDYEFRRSLPQDADEFDWLDLAPSQASLHDHLVAQVRTRLPGVAPSLIEFVVGCVDRRGYFESSIEEMALATQALLEDVELVVDAVRHCEPLGVGAWSVQDCLVLQLQSDSSLESRLARKILRDHFDDFLKGQFRALSRRFQVTPEVIEAAVERIRSLQPYPGETYAPYSSGNSGSSAPAVVADLVLTHTEQGWLVQTKGPHATSLVIDRTYREQHQRIQAGERVAPEERRHIQEFVERAQAFLGALEHRESTLIRIGQVLIEQQAGFVATGKTEFLQPLTRTKLAEDLGLHESTISRATSDKFVQIATGEVVSFDLFFKPALRVQRMIEEILAHENPDHPLSDERIASMLAEQGVVVARRTVNKYRDRTKLLSSRRRRAA